MLFMVIERFRSGRAAEVGERFRARGRMIPEDSGATFLTSWMLSDGSGCYQLMEAPNRQALDAWIAHWQDLVEFEVAPVTPSQEFWASQRPG